MKDIAPDFQDALDQRVLDCVNVGLAQRDIERILAGEVIILGARGETGEPAALVFLRLKKEDIS